MAIEEVIRSKETELLNLNQNWLSFTPLPSGRAVELLPLNSKKKDEFDLTPCEPLPMFLGH